MQAEKKLRKARIHLVQRAPFFGSLALHMNLKEDNSIPTTAVDPHNNLIYNTEFVEKITFEETLGVVAHEVMHCALNVFGRRKGRDMMIWNMAHDYAINLLILDSGLTLPEGVLINDKYRGWTAEQIYEDLVKNGEKPGDPNGQPGEGGLGLGEQGGCCDHSKYDELSSSQKRNEGEKWKQKVAASANAAKMRGNLPSGMERYIDDLLNPQVPWQQILRQFCRDLMLRKDYSYRRPGRRSQSVGWYTPSMPPSMGVPGVYVDTSGSMSRDDLRASLSEIREIIEECKIPVRIIFGDADVASELESDDIDEIIAKCSGGGGTDFRPFFQKMQDEPPSGVIVFSDLDGPFPNEAPSYPVMWVCPGWHKDPPFYTENLIEISNKG
jgi:predicted metal-dependent peptidase